MGTHIVISPIITAVVPRSRQPDVCKKLVPDFEYGTKVDKTDFLCTIGGLSCFYELSAGAALVLATPPNSADYVGLALAADALGRIIPAVTDKLSNGFLGTNIKPVIFASIPVEAGYAVAKAAQNGWQATSGFYKAHFS